MAAAAGAEGGNGVDLDEAEADASERTISSFMPDLLRNEMDTLFSHHKQKTKMFYLSPHSRSFWGVCMSIDVLGFLPHVSRYISHGEDGLGDIKSATTQFVANVVNKVYQYGGDVVEIAGPTLMCVFLPPKAGHHGNSRACMHAIECAWELKDVVLGDGDLSLRIGLSSGEVSVGLLGGHANNWRLVVVAGNKRLLTSLQDQPGKTVLVTREFDGVVLEATAPSPTNMRGRDAYTAAALADTNLLMIKAFKSPGTGKISSGREFNTHATNFDFMTQVYHFSPHPVILASLLYAFDTMSSVSDISCLCVRLDGYEDVTHNRDLRALQSYLYACQEILEDVGGYVSQFTVDARGCVLVALWGVPGAAFEDVQTHAQTRDVAHAGHGVERVEQGRQNDGVR